MADLFFYGTLRYLPLLEQVLGRGSADISLTPAVLSDWAAHWAEGESFPMIFQAVGAEARGLLARDLNPEDLARLDHYEGGFGYALSPLEVRSDDKGKHVAQVFLPGPSQWTPGAPWQLDDWVARYGALTLEAAEEVMERFGNTPAQEIGRLFPWIRARGWARCLARDAAPSTLRHQSRPEDVRIEAVRPGFDGFFRMRAFDISFRRSDNTRSASFAREAFMAFDAALVLPYDPQTDQVLLIEQLRFGPVWRKDPVPWVLEPVAGLVEAGESPAETARREAREEARLELGELKLMTRVYASPGYSTEFFHCYLGMCRLAGDMGGVAGLAEEHEDIRSHILSFDAAMALVESGEINAGPLAMMLLWLAHHRDDLRREGLPARS